MMSQANVDLARSGFAAVSRGELEPLSDLLDADVKWHGSEGPTDESCHNRDEAMHFIQLAIERGVVGELVDVIDAGDQVVVVMRPPNQEQLRANLTTFRNGKVVRMVAYESPEAALAAAGLAE
jgi:ketosteroid isomerase-like protein